MSDKLHSTLQRQLRRTALLDDELTQEKFDAFLQRISASYKEAEETRYTLQRSMELSSEEMRDLYNDLKQTSAKLVEAEQSKLHAVMESLDHGVCTVSPKGEILFLNSAAKRLFGTSPTHYQDMLRRFVPVSAQGKKLDPLALAKKALRGEHLLDYSATLQRSSNDRIKVLASLSPLLCKGSDRAEGLVLTFHDRTQHNQMMRNLSVALEAANQAAQAKGNFLATMSHEIRTPLNGVIGMLDLLLASSLTQEQNKFASIAKSSGESLLRIINDILDYSKLEAGKVQLETAEMDPLAIANDVASVLRPKAQASGLPVDVTVAPGLASSCKADAGRIRQVLFNLVGNAIKFTDQGSISIHVASLYPVTRSRNGSFFLRFEICDTGAGIPTEKIPSLFTPFMQLDASTTRTHGGTGLGLSISGALVRQMGGEMEILSEVGHGSTFSFSVEVQPNDLVVQERRRQGERREKLLEESNDENFSLALLVAEDNHTNQIVIDAMLRRLGYSDITIAEDGKKAVALASERQFDVILMDCMMPELDGFEATKTIRSSAGQVASIPIVALTANAMEGDREKCLAAGMNDYIAKPVSLDSLRQTLQRVFQQTILASTK